MFLKKGNKTMKNCELTNKWFIENASELCDTEWANKNVHCVTYSEIIYHEEVIYNCSSSSISAEATLIGEQL